MEKLFLINNLVYVHMQESACCGVDYSIYDRNSNRLIDGGIIDWNDSHIMTLHDIAAIHGYAPLTHIYEVFCFDDVLDELQTANLH